MYYLKINFITMAKWVSFFCQSTTCVFFQLHCTGVQISDRPVAHGNQNVTWATWKRRKIAQLAIKNSSSPVSLNYRLSVCIVIVFLLPVQLKTQRNISYGFSNTNRDPECVVYRIILRLRSTRSISKFQNIPVRS